jgi:hypothetical protein
VTEPLVFVLPLPINIGNSRTHWAAKLKAKKDYWKVCDSPLGRPSHYHGPSSRR